MNKVATIFYFSCILILLVISVVTYVRSKLELKNEKKKFQKEREKDNKIDKETNDKIESITTGDVAADVHTGADILHQLAQKRK